MAINSANAQFSQNSIAITGLSASVGSTGLQGNLSARNFATPDVTFALSADKIDTAELESRTAKQQPAKPAAAHATPLKPAQLDRQHDGFGHIGSRHYQGPGYSSDKLSCKLQVESWVNNSLAAQHRYLRRKGERDVDPRCASC